ncbi:hypothetical protein [Evansella clarkii]|uniref:hypothetical protein n=1 Tax=Evansella clarkii TaxID=79879 RepID=UPI0009978A52|nr:hypothetical protein [Evansella clarkii]
MQSTNLPIDPVILHKKMEIPKLIAELSYQDEKEALRLMREWGEKKKPITPMYDELTELLSKEKVS